MTTLRKGDIGTEFIGIIKDQDGQIVPIGAASTKTISFQKPDKSVVVKDADFDTDGSDGRLKYVFVDGDLDQAGTWKAQGYVVLDTGMEWRSSIYTFPVEGNLPPAATP